jgi:hypothetical protein
MFLVTVILQFRVIFASNVENEFLEEALYKIRSEHLDNRSFNGIYDKFSAANLATKHFAKLSKIHSEINKTLYALDTQKGKEWFLRESVTIFTDSWVYAGHLLLDPIKRLLANTPDESNPVLIRAGMSPSIWKNSLDLTLLLKNLRWTRLNCLL